MSTWAPLTQADKKNVRLEIDPGWRTGGTDKWKNEKQYLNDGATIYVGPDESFVAAAVNEIPITICDRGGVSPDGIAEIRKEIVRRGGCM
jgi:hypothetical protein